MTGSLVSSSLTVPSKKETLLQQSKLAIGSLKEETCPFPAVLLDPRPSPAVSQLPLQFGVSGLGFQPRRLFLSAAPELGLVPAASVDGLVASRLEALHDLYWRKRLLAAQTRTLSFDEKPSRVSPAVAKEAVKTEVSTKAALPATLFSDCDRNVLSEYQCLVRQQLEFFESSKEEVRWSTQGRGKIIVAGQVGIRCKWCAHLRVQCRSPGAVYYAATMNGLYQAAQNTAKNHLSKECRHIPPDIEQRLNRLRGGKRRGPGGKAYWAEGAQALGIYESEGRLRLKESKVGTTCDSSTTA